MAKAESCKNTYYSIAVITFNFILVLLVVNLFLGAGLAIVTKGKTPLSKYKQVDFTKIYPGLTQGQINELLQESWTNGFIFESFVEFRELPVTGKYVNIDPNGFRRGVNQGPWPPSPAAYNIFVFGGSTTFGYGLQDTATVPSQLQQLMPPVNGRKVMVYNFGRGYYYSTQERVLFEKLLLENYRPDAVIFIDGLNEALKSGTYLDPELAAMFNHASSLSFSFRSFLAHTPLFEVIYKIKRKLSGPAGPAVWQEQESGQLVDRYLSNKRMIEACSHNFKIKSIFVWQPVPTYEYDLKYDVFADDAMIDAAGCKNYFPLVKSKSEQGEMGADFIWSAGLQKDQKQQLYVDTVHYNELACKMLASHIVEQIEARKLLLN